jgi:hypothetical protein
MNIDPRSCGWIRILGAIFASSICGLSKRDSETRGRIRHVSSWFTLTLFYIYYVTWNVIVLMRMFLAPVIFPLSLSPLTEIFLSLDATLPVWRLHNKLLRLTQWKVRVDIWQRGFLIPSCVFVLYVCELILGASSAEHRRVVHTVFCSWDQSSGW